MTWPAYNHYPAHPYRCEPVIHHHIVCRHQIEIEVGPAQVEVYFSDERYVDPINTQVRFAAHVYNAPNNSVTWRVVNLLGGPGAGTIDGSGLYLAPPKGSLPHGHTDLVIATAKADPKRRAVAKVTLIGEGPEPAAEPVLEVYPTVAHLYYQDGPYVHNQYIDPSNKHQQFRTLVRNSPHTSVTWSIVSGPGSISNTGFYYAPHQGTSPILVQVQAQLNHDAAITAQARVVLLNYSWPGIVP